MRIIGRGEAPGQIRSLIGFFNLKPLPDKLIAGTAKRINDFSAILFFRHRLIPDRRRERAGHSLGTHTSSSKAFWA